MHQGPVFTLSTEYSYIPLAFKWLTSLISVEHASVTSTETKATVSRPATACMRYPFVRSQQQGLIDYFNYCRKGGIFYESVMAFSGKVHSEFF